MISKITEIESAITAGKSGIAKKLVKTWLRTHSKTIDNKIQACEWLRRLGLYREAYLVIAPKSWNLTKASQDPETARQLLWTAFILRFHGANRYAVQIADRLSFHDSEKLSVLGGIYLTGLDYEKSLKAYRRAYELLPKKNLDSYFSRALICNLAYSLSSLGHHDEAVKVLSSIKIANDDEYWKCSVQIYLGEFHAKAGRFSTAKKILASATKFALQDEKSLLAEHLFLMQGYVEGALGNTDKSTDLFAKAFDLFYSPDSRAEYWLDCYYLQHRLGLADAEKQLTLFSYPDLSEGFRNRPKYVNAVSVWSPQSSLILFPERDEWIENGAYKLRMSQTLHLLAWLRASGKYGISMERLKPMLWPDELSSYVQLTNRIEKLLGRIKKDYGVTTKVEAGTVKITDSEINVSVEILRRSGLPHFLEKNPEFEIEQFAQFYGLGLTAARKSLDHEIELGHIELAKVGRKYQYRVLRASL